MASVLEPRAGKAWRDEVRALVHKLEDGGPTGYDGQRIAPYRAQQTRPIMDSGLVYPAARLDLIQRAFEFAGGRRAVVRLTRVAFVNLLRALRDVPRGIEVGFGSAYFASWRSWSMQSQLYNNYRAGGPLAAPPGRSWHHRCSVDLGLRTEEGRAAMLEHGFEDLLPQDPPHFTFGRRG